MGTRAVIARQTTLRGNKARGFTGRYHHWDGYPTSLGATLHTLYHGHFRRDLPAMLKYLLDDHPAGWSTINGADFTQAPGFEESGFQTEGPHCYCHGGRSEKANTITQKNASGCGCEYAYVFDVARNVMLVFSSVCADGSKMVGYFGAGDDDATWQLLGEVNLADPTMPALLCERVRA